MQLLLLLLLLPGLALSSCSCCLWCCCWHGASYCHSVAAAADAAPRLLEMRLGFTRAYPLLLQSLLVLLLLHAVVRRQGEPKAGGC